MSQAKLDENYVKTKLGVSNLDGITPLLMYADPITHRLKVNINAGGQNLGNNFASHDENFETVILGASKVDESPVQIYVQNKQIN